ncbi:MAG: hypothetical protein AMXMBFR46_19370 [Acidimicrobiia bacterium]
MSPGGARELNGSSTGLPLSRAIAAVGAAWVPEVQGAGGAAWVPEVRWGDRAVSPGWRCVYPRGHRGVAQW